MVAIRCSCNGANPTCFKCDGWGYLEPGVRETMQQVAVLPGPKLENGKLSTKTNNSSADLLFSKRGRKAAAVHDSHQIDRNSKNMNAGMIKCPICSGFVLKKNIKKHLSRVHGVLDEKQKYNGHVIASETVVKKSISCLFCDRILTAGFVISHVDRCGGNLKEKILIKKEKIKKYTKYTNATSLVKCPKCECEMLGMNLKKHLNKCLGYEDISKFILELG